MELQHHQPLLWLLLFRCSKQCQWLHVLIYMENLLQGHIRLIYKHQYDTERWK